MDSKIVSAFNARQYMVNEFYEVFFYGDINLKHVSAHSHDHYEIYLFINGDVLYQIEDKEYRLKNGDMLVLPPGIKHRAIVRDNSISYQRFVFWVQPKFLDFLAIQDKTIFFFSQFVQKHRIYHFSLHPNEAQNLISSMVELLSEVKANELCSSIRSNYLAANVLVYINRMLYYLEKEKGEETKKELYLNIASYITNHLTEELTLDGLAEIFFISKYHMAHHFKENMGISIHQYILNKRMELAKMLILSGAAVSKLPNQCGFKDYATFYRAFKKCFGISPAKLKEKYRIDSYFNPTGD